MASKLEKDVFVNVYGYEDIERELRNIREWLTDEANFNNPKIMLPKGVIFYGEEPGNGKTLMLRDFANSFNAPIFVIEGEEDNTCKEVIEVFKKARSEKFAIVLIDEIDLLIDDAKTARAFQQEIDGINKDGFILVLATTNRLYRLPKALLRSGRLDKLISVDNPSYESRINIIKNFIKDLNVDGSNIDYNHVAKVCGGCSGADLKAVCNDCYLRCKNNITTDELEISYERVINKNYSNRSIEYKNYRVAVHEACHALMTMHFNNNWSFYKAKFNSKGGTTEVQAVDENEDTIEKREQSIMIGMSGYVGEEIIFGYHEVGSFGDYTKVNNMIERLVERVCVKGINYLIPEDYYDRGNLHWTESKLRKSEVLVNRLKKKYESKTRKYLKRNKKEIIRLADMMYKNGRLTKDDALKGIK